MSARALALWALLGAAAAAPALSAEAGADAPPPSTEVPAAPEPVKIRAKAKAAEGGDSLLQPDVAVVDAPTSAVLDYGGYAAQSRFYSHGGVLQTISFGVFHGLNLGASLAVDGLVGNERVVRVRAPNAQIKWRFYDGDRHFPSLAVGYDGQGHLYNQPIKRYNQRQRGAFIVATQELGLPGLLFHPSMNISDFDSNSIFGCLPLTLNIKDKVSLLAEWDNINDFRDSRLNAGLRTYVTPRFHVDFAVRGIGQGGLYSDGNSRGPERIVQLRYSGSF